MTSRIAYLQIALALLDRPEKTEGNEWKRREGGRLYKYSGLAAQSRALLTNCIEELDQLNINDCQFTTYPTKDETPMT